MPRLNIRDGKLIRTAAGAAGVVEEGGCCCGGVCECPNGSLLPPCCCPPPIGTGECIGEPQCDCYDAPCCDDGEVDVGFSSSTYVYFSVRVEQIMPCQPISGSVFYTAQFTGPSQVFGTTCFSRNTFDLVSTYTQNSRNSQASGCIVNSTTANLVRQSSINLQATGSGGVRLSFGTVNAGSVQAEWRNSSGLFACGGLSGTPAGPHLGSCTPVLGPLGRAIGISIDLTYSTGTGATRIFNGSVFWGGATQCVGDGEIEA